MAAETVSPEDQEFLARCEKELKDRYTTKDENFMIVFNAEPSKPPVIDPWWVANNPGRRNHRRNRQYHPYERERSSRGRDNHDRHGNRGHRGYDDYRGSDDRGYRPNRNRYHY